MLELTLNIASWLLILGGSVFAVVGGIGMHSLNDFFARTHASSVTDTGGAGLLLMGLLLQAPDWIVAVKLLMILLFLWFTSPTAAHILAQAALGDGLTPKLAASAKSKDKTKPAPNTKKAKR